MDDPAKLVLHSAMRAADETFLAFAGMRNEGPFIVEWVCWYRMLGFEVLVATNDCTDHSPELLDRLQEEGWLTHVRHRVPQGMNPKRSAYRAGRNHPLTERADWVLVCDVDEFLVLNTAETIQEFIGDGERDLLGMAFFWNCFGTGGRSRYEDGLVHRQFRRTGPSDGKANCAFKSMFRLPLDFAAWGDHTPYRFAGRWGEGDAVWVDASGRELKKFSDPEKHPIRQLPQRHISHAAAHMNHYILRSREDFEFKRGRPSATAGKDRYTDRFLRRYDRNDCRDISADQFAERFDSIHANAMSLPGVRRLHHLCCADYVAELCASQGRDCRKDRRWRHHTYEAEALASTG